MSQTHAGDAKAPDIVGSPTPEPANEYGREVRHVVLLLHGIRDVVSPWYERSKRILGASSKAGL
ncbi:MAG: hypothetical protein KDB22_17495 [Planctomycetales bacterium]|nr:hypothetical protein [Planctomycetales bacterium]